MGTNYYWYPEKDCPCCGRNEEGIHIGKSGHGWAFSLHVGRPNSSDIPINLEQWIRLFNRKNSIIKDEYGDKIPVEEMLSIILNREDYHNKDTILRHHDLSDHCIAHFDTYDHCVGMFR